MTVTVTETTDSAFTTEVQTGNTKSTLGSKVTDHTASVTTNDGNDKFILFTNTLTTIDVTVRKTVEGKGGTFNFMAFLRYNDAAVQDYTLSTSIVTGNAAGGNAGKANFTLQPAYNGTENVVFSIPAGSVLELKETGVPDNPQYNTTATAQKRDSSLLSTSNYNAATRTYTLPATQTVEDLTVTFTNTEIYPSPTGYTARMLPFAMMLASGLFLIPVTLSGKRRKKEEN